MRISSAIRSIAFAQTPPARQRRLGATDDGPPLPALVNNAAALTDAVLR